jgi:hypothetical protein
VALIVALATDEAKAADQVRISGLSDVAFGTISNFGADSVRQQNICVYAKTAGLDQYTVAATGSGSGGAFLLSSGSNTLPYEVQWNALSGQTAGTQLVANQPLTGLTAGGGNQDDCSKGPPTTASLIVIIRSAAVSAAISGTYNGTLTLLVAPN